jgi:fructose-specific phosphotransferase system IIC component
MDNNLYQPPRSELDPRSTRPRRPGSLVKALLTGTGIEIIGTLVAALGIGVVYALLLRSAGDSADDAAKAFDPLSPMGLIGGALGLAVSVFAGYACAAIANRDDYKPSYAMASISVGLGLLMDSGESSPLTLLVLSVLTVGAVLFGGWLHLRDPKAD